MLHQLDQAFSIAIGTVISAALVTLTVCVVATPVLAALWLLALL